MRTKYIIRDKIEEQQVRKMLNIEDLDPDEYGTYPCFLFMSDEPDRYYGNNIYCSDSEICHGCEEYADCLTYDVYDFRIEKLKRILS